MPLKILVVDDSATMRQIMQMTFAGEDAQVVVVSDAAAAVSSAQSFVPDLVFADASLDAPDGYEVARAIKLDPNLARAAVILLSSQHSPYDPDRGRDAGVDDHVAKPFDTQNVIDKVAQVLSRPRAVASGTVSPDLSGEAAAPDVDIEVEAPAPPMPTTATGTVKFGDPLPDARARPSRPVLELADESIAGGPSPEPIAEEPEPEIVPAPAPAAASAVAVATSNGGAMARKLEGMGLSPAQVEGVLSLSREVIEQVVWEVVPDLAETIIREEIARLTAG